MLLGKDPPTGALLIAKVLHGLCTRCGGGFVDPRLEKAVCLRTSARRRGHWSCSHAVACLIGSARSSMFMMRTSQAFTGLCYACR